MSREKETRAPAGADGRKEEQAGAERQRAPRILLIGGASHAGKTLLAQQVLETYGYPYLSIDHLKMGLIRSGMTDLTPLSSTDELTDLLWPIVRGMILTAHENGQNLVVEGCYIPADWKSSIPPEYLPEIRELWLVMTEDCVRQNFRSVREHASVIEERKDDADCTMEAMLAENARVRKICEEHNLPHILIADHYPSPEEMQSAVDAALV